MDCVGALIGVQHDTVLSLIADREIGPGSLHRAVATAQREFLQAKPIVEHDQHGKYYRGSDWVRSRAAD